jgi:hypothetical protein
VSAQSVRPGGREAFARPPRVLTPLEALFRYRIDTAWPGVAVWMIAIAALTVLLIGAALLRLRSRRIGGA